jgi:hypothetical protein
MTPSIELVVGDSLADAYSAAYAYVYYSVIALGGVAIIGACVLRDYDHKLTNHVAKQIYHGDRNVDLAMTEEKADKQHHEGA